MTRETLNHCRIEDVVKSEGMAIASCFEKPRGILITSSANSYELLVIAAWGCMGEYHTKLLFSAERQDIVKSVIGIKNKLKKCTDILEPVMVDENLIYEQIL